VFSCPVDENSSGEYIICRHRGFRLTVLRQAFSEDFLEICCRESTKEKIPFTVVPSSRYALVCHFEYEGRGYFHKSFWHRNRLESIKGFFRGTRAERSLRGYLLLRNSGLDAPRVVLVGKRALHNFTVSEAVRDGRGLRQFFQEVNGRAPYKEEIAEKKRVIGELGRTVGRMHALGIFHGDLRLGNVMVDLAGPKGPHFIFLDNERTVRYRNALPPRKRLKNLVQLNMDILPTVTHTDRLRFFEAYLAETPELISQRKLWLRRVVEKTAERHKKKMRKDAVSPC